MPTSVLAGHYLLLFALLGVVNPYLGLFLQGRAFNGEQIGQVLALFGLMQVISPNIWGWLADRLGQRAIISSSVLGCRCAPLCLCSLAAASC